MKILLVTFTFPYPPNDGCNLDRWNRIVALSRRGISIHLVTWLDKQPLTEEQLKASYTCCDSVSVYQRNRAPYLALHPKYPTAEVSRLLPKDAYEVELRKCERISPDIVFLDTFIGASVGMSLAQDLDIPLVYRSHNVEYQYEIQLFLAQRNPIRKVFHLSNIWRKKRLEQHVRNFSSLIYDISAEDRDAWRDHPSAPKAKVLSFYLHPDEKYTSITSDDSTNDIDVLYVGNLRTPNNVFGLKWFARELVPLLKGLSITVAGSKPTPEIYNAFSRANVEVIADPEEVLPLYRRARVLVNPIWHGSGLNIKMVEALATGKPVVSTSVGTRGLSERLRAHVHVADDPKSFASAVLRHCDDGVSARQQNDVAKEHSWIKVAALIRDFNELVSKR